MLDPFVFSLTVLFILATPGPTNTLLATSGALVGVRRSLPLIAAELTGYLTAIACLHFLLGELVARHSWLNAGLRLAIGAYLLYAAWELWTRREMLQGARTGVRFDRVLVTTLLNPKAIVFAFGVIPLSSPDALAYVAAFVGFVVAAASSWIAAGAFAGAMASQQGSRLIPRISAVVLALFAGLIATGI